MFIRVKEGGVLRWVMMQLSEKLMSLNELTAKTRDEAHGEGSYRRGGAGVEEEDLQAAEGCGGGFQRPGEEPAGVSTVTWQGLENASIHVSLVLMAAYAVCIAAYGIAVYGIGRPELRQSVAFFA